MQINTKYDVGDVVLYSFNKNLTTSEKGIGLIANIYYDNLELKYIITTNYIDMPNDKIYYDKSKLVSEDKIICKIGRIEIKC